MWQLKSLQIRTVLSSLVVAMGSLLIISSLVQTASAIHEKHEANRVYAIATVSRTLFRTFVSTRIERGTFVAVTVSEHPATDPEKIRIASNREISERMYQVTMAELGHIDVPGLESARRRVLVAHDAMQALRQRIDVQILKPQAAREPSLIEDSPRIAGDYVAALVALSDLIDTSIQRRDAVVDYFLTIKRAAWAVRTYGGQIALRIERAAAAGKGWSPEDLAAAAQDAGQADYAWSLVRADVELRDTPKRLVDLVNLSKQYFSGPMADERKSLIGTLAGGGKIVIPIRDLQERNTVELGFIVDVANEALDEMVLRAHQQRRHAGYVLFVSMGLVALALLFTVLGFLLVYFRVSLPLRRMTLAMKRLASHRLDTAGSDDEPSARQALDFKVPYVGRLDEIGDTARSLEYLRGSLIEKQELTLREKEHCEQLHRAEKELIEVEKLAALGRLVAGIAHEINTPIGSALMVATTLQEHEQELSRKLEENQGRMQRSDLENFLVNVRTAAEIQLRALSSAAKLVRNFKQVAVDQAGEHQRAFELGELVEQVVSTLRPTFKHVPYRIALAIDEKIVMKSFPGPLGQVVTNLIVNSFVHGFEGRETGTVTVSAESAGGLVKVTVADDGVGISPQNLPHIFEPFYTTKFGQGGSGLGLHIVHSIVTVALRGTVSVDTVEGEGTAFVVTLPLDL
ncbi:sensor histidine kinase [Paraburkholderia fungorum]|uniref:histidine kinase n=1 Tax=Paraburkholderia fungorum TaxID=134537 RepID=A0A420GGE4_9BURK|nr:ATP-binding protein [Paraburkholderia fungorum]RKF44212.1 hypothetical protein BCY88_29190 [Paraburkholderia fungorum]